MASRFARQILPATATRGVVFSRESSPRWQGGPRRSYRRAFPTNGSGTVARCSSSMARPSRCRTPQRIKPCIPSRQLKNRGLAFRSPGLRYCYRWQLALVTIWPSRRTKAKVPAKRISFDKCTTRSNPVMWFLPTPCSTITSSHGNCAGAVSTSWLALSTSARGVG